MKNRRSDYALHRSFLFVIASGAIHVTA